MPEKGEQKMLIVHRRPSFSQLASTRNFFTCRRFWSLSSLFTFSTFSWITFTARSEVSLTTWRFLIKVWNYLNPENWGQISLDIVNHKISSPLSSNKSKISHDSLATKQDRDGGFSASFMYSLLLGISALTLSLVMASLLVPNSCLATLNFFKVIRVICGKTHYNKTWIKIPGMIFQWS